MVKAMQTQDQQSERTKRVHASQKHTHKETVMNRTKIASAAMALAFVAVIGLSGTAVAGPHHMGQNLSPEQYKAMQDTYAEFDKKIEPLRLQFHAKKAELHALYYQGTAQNDPKVQALVKELGELDAKMYAARTDLRNQLNDKGVPVYSGRGRGGCPMMGDMGRGHGGGHGGGYGGGHGGMMRHGGGW